MSMLSARRSSLLSGSAVYLLANVLSAAVPFALLPVLTRYLLPAEYGQVAMFQTLAGALGAFVGLNVVGAAGRKYYDEGNGEEQLRHFIAACLQILGASSLVVFAVLLAFREQLAGWLGLEVKWVLAAALVCGLSVIVQLRLGQWQVRGKAYRYAAMQIAWSVLNVSLSLLLVVFLAHGAGGRIAAQVIAVAVVAVVALLLLHRDRLFALFVWRPDYLREALGFGVPLVPHIAGMFLINTVDRFVINAELGLAAAGIYMVAVQLSNAMALVFDAINNAYVPWLYERLKRDQWEEKKQIVRYTYTWYALVLAGAGAVFLAGPWLVTLVAGEKYAAAGDVIGWLAIGQAFGGMYLMVTNYIFYSKRTGLLSIATISTGILNLALVVVLVRSLGMQGAAIGFAVAMALRFLLTWWVAQRRHPMPWLGLQGA